MGERGEHLPKGARWRGARRGEGGRGNSLRASTARAKPQRTAWKISPGIGGG